eukprot:4149383-Amphidinium_carterae.1
MPVIYDKCICFALPFDSYRVVSTGKQSRKRWQKKRSIPCSMVVVLARESVECFDGAMWPACSSHAAGSSSQHARAWNCACPRTQKGSLSAGLSCRRAGSHTLACDAGGVPCINPNRIRTITRALHSKIQMRKGQDNTYHGNKHLKYLLKNRTVT